MPECTECGKPFLTEKSKVSHEGNCPNHSSSDEFGATVRDKLAGYEWRFRFDE